MTKEEAAAAVLEALTSQVNGAGWEPVITQVDDAADAWRVFYNSKAFIASGRPSDALAGNWPYLVPKEGGEPRLDEDYRRSELGT